MKLQVEQLPDLNIPRAGHEVFCVNGELTVAGGHTEGFVPTPTAEYYKDGEWHTIQMTYPHDNAFSVVLRSGKVMLGGGSEQPIGIGQTFVTETYDPRIIPSMAIVVCSGNAPVPLPLRWIVAELSLPELVSRRWYRTVRG